MQRNGKIFILQKDFETSVRKSRYTRYIICGVKMTQLVLFEVQRRLPRGARFGITLSFAPNASGSHVFLPPFARCLLSFQVARSFTGSAVCNAYAVVTRQGAAGSWVSWVTTPVTLGVCEIEPINPSFLKTCTDVCAL